MREGYEFGEDFELDEIRADVNMKKVIKGLDKNLKEATRRK
jgi:hypothetical protein